MAIVSNICIVFVFNFSVSVQLYSPDRPLVDTAEVFLWLMAVGTILCASYWSAWSAREAVIEQEKLLKVLNRSLFDYCSGFCLLEKRTNSHLVYVGWP